MLVMGGRIVVWEHRRTVQIREEVKAIEMPLWISGLGLPHNDSGRNVGSRTEQNFPVPESNLSRALRWGVILVRKGVLVVMDNLSALREQRLRIRARIRALNIERPRCAGCGGDMLKFEPGDFITSKQYGQPGWEWLEREDLRPGDLLCFWCAIGIAELENQFAWGHA